MDETSDEKTAVYIVQSKDDKGGRIRTVHVLPSELPQTDIEVHQYFVETSKDGEILAQIIIVGTNGKPVEEAIGLILTKVYNAGYNSGTLTAIIDLD